MKFSEKMKDIFEKGVDASRDMLSKAGSQAQTWGEQGKLKIEIAQLQGQAQKLTSRLGAEVYDLLIEQGLDSVYKDSPLLAPLLKQIQSLDLEIDEKEAAVKNLGGKVDDLHS